MDKLSFRAPGCMHRGKFVHACTRKQKVQACSKRSSFSQSVSMRDYILHSIHSIGHWTLIIMTLGKLTISITFSIECRYADKDLIIVMLSAVASFKVDCSSGQSIRAPDFHRKLT